MYEAAVRCWNTSICLAVVCLCYSQLNHPVRPAHRTAALPYIVTGMNGFAGLPNNDLRLGPAASKINRPMAPLPDTVGLAEFGSVQVEFDALSARTGNESYAKAADGIIHLLHKNYPDQVSCSSL